MNLKYRTYLLYVLFGVIAFQSCSKDNSTVTLAPNAGQHFLDVENEGYVVTLNATAPSGLEKGTWRIYSGQNGFFDDINDPETIFHGEPGESYQIGWELSLGKKYEADVITISFKALQAVINTNPSDTIVDNISLYVEAEEPRFGATGYWQIIEGDSGYFIDSTLFNAEFIGVEDTNYKLRWNLEYGSKNSSTELSFRTDTLRANAGNNRRYIKNKVVDELKYTSLNAFLPAGAKGIWSLIDGDGGKVYLTDQSNSLFEGKAMEDYLLTWSVNLDGRTSIDTVNIHFRDKWGQWTDERDGQNYHTVEINGLEWFAENYNYYQPAQGYNWSFYYGQSAQAFIRNGEPVETEEDKKLYGRLYNNIAAINWAPEGWRLPTTEEFSDMVDAIGGEERFFRTLMKDGDNGLDLVFGGGLNYSGDQVGLKDFYFDQDGLGYLWTNSYDPNTYAAIVCIHDTYNMMFREVSAIYFTTSVRYVRDIKPEE